MPRLLYFLPCDRVIMSEDGTVSLITVIEGATINLPNEEEINLPADAVMPIQWNTVSEFLWEKSEAEKQYEQRVYLTMPDGRISTDVTAIFSREIGKERSRNIVRVQGFPIVPAGTAFLRLALRVAGENEEWQELAEYPIKISRAKPVE